MGIKKELRSGILCKPDQISAGKHESRLQRCQSKGLGFGMHAQNFMRLLPESIAFKLKQMKANALYPVLRIKLF
jgi:hypothetical protein